MQKRVKKGGKLRSKNKKPRSNSLDNIIIKLIEKDFKVKKVKIKRPSVKPKKKDYSISSIAKSSIQEAIKKIKSKKKSKEDKIFYLDKENLESSQGGYGTTSSQIYGGLIPKGDYVNYSKLFSHLGVLKAKGMYEQLEDRQKEIRKNTESTKEMVSMETIEKAAWHFKYAVRGEVMGDIGYIPPVGMNVDSKEWEKYRLMSMMSVYRPIIKLMNTMA